MGDLRPFFLYFGGKWRAAKRYPPPKHEIIVEPFAGSAGYSLRYPDQQVHLVDANETIAGIWDYLIHVSPEEILALKDCAHVDDLGAVPQEARHLVGMWLKRGLTEPVLKRNGWSEQARYAHVFWGPQIRARIARQVPRIRHWRVRCGDYRAIGNASATWFVDPPYSGPPGRLYPKQVADYAELADWCRAREGQTIVCEQQGATWMPFQTLYTVEGTNHKRTVEVVWTRG